jgi:diketogulonate reductase-like aldo/keto reductase
MVRTITLNDGKKIPSLAWGNGSGGVNSRAAELGTEVLKAGITHIDTAQVRTVSWSILSAIFETHMLTYWQIYGTEAETNEAIHRAGVNRDDVWVTSKREYAMWTSYIRCTLLTSSSWPERYRL